MENQNKQPVPQKQKQQQLSFDNVEQYREPEEKNKQNIKSNDNEDKDKKIKKKVQKQNKKEQEQQKYIKTKQMPNMSVIKEQNQALFDAAEGQRKTMNLTQFRQYMTKRASSFHERNRIYELFRAKFHEKQKNTRKFHQSVIRYFDDYSDLLKYLSKSINKLELKKKYSGNQMQTAVKQSITELINLNDAEADHVDKFIDWLDKILIQALKSAQGLFKDRVKKVTKNLEQVDYQYYDNLEKQTKTYDKMSDGSDLLQRELILVQKIKTTNQSAIQRGVKLYEAWETLLAEQRTIKKLLQQNILQFHQRYVKFHRKLDNAKNLYVYWKKLPLDATVIQVFQSVLDQKAIEFINYNCKSKRIGDNFESFLRLKQQQKRIGNPFPLLDILMAKKFKSKLQKSHRDWKEVSLVFTIDHNLVIFDEKQGKSIMKLRQATVKVLRASENILELSGVQTGIIFDSTRKQSIHFQKLDEVEEFIYYVQSIPQRNEKK